MPPYSMHIDYPDIMGWPTPIGYWHFLKTKSDVNRSIQDGFSEARKMNTRVILIVVYDDNREIARWDNIDMSRSGKYKLGPQLNPIIKWGPIKDRPNVAGRALYPHAFSHPRLQELGLPESFLASARRWGGGSIEVDPGESSRWVGYAPESREDAIAATLAHEIGHTKLPYIEPGIEAEIGAWEFARKGMPGISRERIEGSLKSYSVPAHLLNRYNKLIGRNPGKTRVSIYKEYEMKRNPPGFAAGYHSWLEPNPRCPACKNPIRVAHGVIGGNCPKCGAIVRVKNPTKAGQKVGREIRDRLKEIRREKLDFEHGEYSYTPELKDIADAMRVELGEVYRSGHKGKLWNPKDNPVNRKKLSAMLRRGFIP